jgi:E3 ubiquitin-protein ligase RGLG
VNAQFVNFTSIMSRNATLQQKESAFALAALMEVPIQYKATMELGILGRTTGKAKRVVPAPPPLPASSQRQPSSLRREGSGANATAPAEPREDQVRLGIVEFRLMIRHAGVFMSPLSNIN